MTIGLNLIVWPSYPEKLSHLIDHRQLECRQRSSCASRCPTRQLHSLAAASMIVVF